MRSLLPDSGDVDDVTAAVWAEPRGPGPWVMANMVSSLDGAATVAGRSGPLGGEGDRALFGALRGRADVILVGAGTVHAERYGPPRDPAAGDRRTEAGMAPRPVVAVVSNSLELDLDLPLFGDERRRPVVVTHEGADPGRRRDVGAVAEVVDAGAGAVDVTTAVAVLARRHGPIVLCEGGPSLLGTLHEADLVDEWCVTLGAVAVAGGAPRIARSEGAPARDLRLARVWVDGDELLLRYLRDR